MAAPLLTLSDISLGFGGAPLLDAVSLAIAPGDRIGLVGRNGSGKSTLMRVMAGLVEPDAGSRFVPPGKAVAFMEQDPDFAPFATLGDFVAAGLPGHAAHRAERALSDLALDGATDAAGASGGERRRAALARLIAQEADLLLLDEPTNHLDIAMIATLEARLAAQRKAFVLVSHDRAFLRALTRATLWVDRGQLRRQERGFDAFEDWREKTYAEEDAARHKQARLIAAESRWAVEGISGRRRRNMGRVRRLEQLRADRAAALRRPGQAALQIDSGATSGRLVAEAKGLSKAFAGRSLVRDFSLRLQRGDRLAVIGPNGAGKTTLVNLLTGQTAPDAGTVRLGTHISMAIFDQNRAALDPEATLWDSLTQVPDLGVRGQSDQVMVRGRPRHVVGYLKDFLFTEDQARSPIGVLSGGERARLLLARLLARESNLLVLDEPTNDLDVETLDLMQEMIDGYDGTVILVSHDRDFLDRVATLSVVMPGDGSAEIYAGGFADAVAQGARLTAPDRPAPAKKPTRPAALKPTSPPPRRLGYAQTRRLAALPAEIERLTAEIAKLERLLSDPDLYRTDPDKFTKAGAALARRKDLLGAAEDEWLELETLREAAE
ncbi:MAG: ATP-binding cassette domain-containing protein [Pseudomonadota bacterium]